MVFTPMKLKRVLKGFTQEEAALELGISQSYLSQIENYTVRPENKILKKMIYLYSCEMKDLFPEETS